MEQTEEMKAVSSYEGFCEVVKDHAIRTNPDSKEWKERVEASIAENEDILRSFYDAAKADWQKCVAGEISQDIAFAWIQNEIGTCSWNIEMLA